MFHHEKSSSSDLRTSAQNYNNGVKQQKTKQFSNNSAINQTNNFNNSKPHQSKSSFFNFFNPFSSSNKISKSQTINSREDTTTTKNSDSDQSQTAKSVKVLKQFWNDQIKTAKSSEHLNSNCSNNSKKSATIKYFSQSNDSINEINRVEKSLTLDGSYRLPLDDFNKFKDANFIRNKKNKLLGSNSNKQQQQQQQSETNVINTTKHTARTESSNLNDNHFPQISATGGKIHWAKRDEILFAKKSPAECNNDNSFSTIMSVKTNKVNATAASNGKNLDIPENGGNKSKSSSDKSKSVRSDSVTSSIASSINSSNSSNTNSASRKISFKTNPATTSSYMNKKLANGGGSCSKVAQIAQRFNQLIQQDATILDEVKKRGGVVVHRSGGRVFKIKEEKVNGDKGNAAKKSANNEDTMSDDAISLPSIGKNSTRKKSSLKKRPSIRIMVESPRKDGNGNVLSKRQLYETNIVNKETIVIKPKVPDKSERVLAKTKELKNKKMLNEIMKTEAKNVKINDTTASTNKDNNNTCASNKELNNTLSANASKSNSSSCIDVNGETHEENHLPKINETIEPIKDTTSKNNLRKIYDKITFRPTFLYGKKSNSNKVTETTTSLLNTQSVIIASEINNIEIQEEEEDTAENNKAYNDDIAINEIEIEDEFELKPIDLNLNVYFNDENLSNNTTNIEEEKNVSSQGPMSTTMITEDVDDVIINADDNTTKPDQKQSLIDMKPNSSFLFRTQSSTKFDTACDTFIRSMLNENSTTEINIDDYKINLLHSSTSILVCADDHDDNDDNDNASVKCITQENDYEIISRDFNENDKCDKLAKEKKIGECDDDIDKNNSNVSRRQKYNNDDNDDIKEDDEEENIYQSLCEVKGENGHNNNNNNNDTISVKSYESFENYDEIKQNILDNKINLSDILKSEDDYIFPNAIHSEIPPELPAPRKNTIPKISSPILTSTTSNLVQANLPMPKHNNVSYELKKSNSCTSTTYEKIKYDQLPQSKQKHSHNQQNVELPLPPRNNISNNINIQHHHHKQRDENIYDTIKSYGCSGDNRSISTEYENIPDDDDDNNDNESDKNVESKITLRKESYYQQQQQQQDQCESFDMINDDGDNPYKNSKNDTMSIISNCYESISLKQNYSTINQILRHAISTTTLSSEHRINSIYGIGQSLTPPSDRSGGSDNNSDEWIDVESEDEAEAESNNDRFIVICKKTKTHQKPDWSRLIRQKLDEWEDDSDHHYESLYSIQQQRAVLEGKLENEKPLSHNNQQLPSNNNGVSNQNFDNDDDYSSFDSDDDENGHEEKSSSQAVDLINAKLPEPPVNASGQVYAIVQRLKNFGSISKIEISKGFSKITKKRSSLGKMPSSKFYETTEITEESTTTEYVAPKYDNKSIGKKSRGLSKLSKLGRLTINKLPANFNLSDDQSDYQSSKMTSKGNNESNSSLNKLSNNNNNNNSSRGDLNASDNDVEFQNQKNNKSFKAKFRKSSTPSIGSASTSNIYGSLASKNSTFYVTDSLDVDSGIFAVNEKSTSSPDNSNLNLNSSSNSNISCDPKRRSIAGINTSRPKDSPPPPPSERKSRLGTTSWYAECGLFKSESEHDESEKSDKVMTSWYHESGLYQPSNNSVASSSGSSGVSTGGECSPCGDENSHSMFLNEPLYQLYTAAKLESISSSEFEQETESDGYEEIHKKDMQENSNKKPSRPSALQLIEPNQGPLRSLWSEVNEVIHSGVLSTLQTNEKRLQEAKFEILTSEASYLKSLNLLKSHFMNHPAFRDPQNLDPQDRKTLFSYIIPVQECSDRLLCDLESCWQDSIMLKNLAKHIFKHAEKHFHVYISYCEHQGRLDRTLKRLKENNASFKETLDILENDPICCGLTIHSFLMLPMQRITRLPLLIDAVMTKLKAHDEEFDDWKMAMAIANKIVDQCNQAANRCEQAIEMEMLSRQIEFQQNITPFPLIPFNTSTATNNNNNNNNNNGNNRLTRTLVRRGELTHIIYRGDDAKLTFGKKATVKKNIYCFLFTDVILLSKKKSEESYVVFDYCQRSLLQLSSGDVIPQIPSKDINHAGKFIVFMSLLENSFGKPVDYILACPSETERQRWLQATAPILSENPYETLYEQWDCPQVIANHAYQALEPDELTLDVGDVVNVLRKMKDDGWYYGERIRDSAQGWFPGNFSTEVHSAHVRARNLKQRHRLLLYTATYLEAQKDVNTKRK